MSKDNRDKISGKQFSGNLALITDSRNANLNLANCEVLAVLKSKNLAVKMIDLADPTIWLKRDAWQGIDYVWLGLSSCYSIVAGSLQGFLDILGIGYTGPGMLTAALAGDRTKSKKIWQVNGIATTPFFSWTEQLNWQEILGLVGLPLAVKSLSLHNKDLYKIVNLKQVNEIPNKFKNLHEVIIEPWIAGEEYVVYIIDQQALNPIKLRNDLYHADSLNLTKIKKLALDAFLAIGGDGFAAVYILQDLNCDYWILHIDVGLSLTRKSNFAMAAAQSGIEFEDLVFNILATSCIKKTKDFLISH